MTNKVSKTATESQTLIKQKRLQKLHDNTTLLVGVSALIVGSLFYLFAYSDDPIGNAIVVILEVPIAGVGICLTIAGIVKQVKETNV